MLTKEPSALYGIIAEFDTPEELTAAANAAREAGFKKMDAFTPFPVPGLPQAIGVHDKFIPILMLCGAILGACWGLGIQIFAFGASLPINIGGRPMWSWPNYIPIMFEATILTCAVTGVVMMFALNGLPQPYHPTFDAPNFDRASTDKFFLLIEAADAQFDRENTMKFLQQTGTERVNEIEVRR